MSLFSKDERVSAVFDIGNGSIGVALVAFSEKNKPPTIMYTYREPLTFLPTSSSQHLLSAMLKLLRSVSVHLEKNGLKYAKHSIFNRHPIHDVFCVFASPWYVSETGVMKIEKDKPFTASHALIEESLKNKIHSDAATITSYKNIFPGNLRTIEEKIVGVTLNGYEVDDPAGKTARELEVTYFSSAVGEVIVRKVEDVISASINFETISFYSYAFAAWMGSRDIFPGCEDFLFIDVTNETTDIVVCVKGILRHTQSFSSGRAAVLRRLVKELTITPELALSFLDMRAKSAVEPSFSRNIDNVLKAVGADWLAQLQENLKKIQERQALPKQVFITVDDDVSSLFIETLRSLHSSELSVPHNTFDITYLTGQIFKDHNQYLTTLAPDPFLSLESIFLGKRSHS